MAMDEALISQISASVLRRRGVTWSPGDALAAQAAEAAAAAIGLLRAYAGNDSLPLTGGAEYDLAVVATWYLMDNRRAEFLADYKQELLLLRMQEAVADAGSGTDVS